MEGSNSLSEEEKVCRKHPGVFILSAQQQDSEDEVVAQSYIDDESSYSKSKDESDEKQDAQGEKTGLDTLPSIDRLRESSLERSTASGDKSENGENTSDRESGVTGTRNLRSKNQKKPQPKSSKRKPSKPTGLSTRSSKGKGRRSLMKQKPIKSIATNPTPITSDRIYFNGEYFRKGDIVSVGDTSSGDIFYAQLRGFLTDEYGQKSGVISWLYPTTGSPPPEEGFHPATYILGYEEDLPRKMEVFTFVMHAPSDYFYLKSAPYRTSNTTTTTQYNNTNGFTTLRLGPRVRMVKDKAYFVGNY